MDSTIHLSFRYSEQDYVLAVRAHYSWRLRIKLDIAAVVVSASLGAYLWQSSNSRLWGIGLVCLSAILTLMLISAFVVIPRLVFRREPKFRDEYSLAFSQAGIHFQTAHINSQLQWSMYSRALIDAHSFVLYHGTHAFTVIPKRVFETTDQLVAFEHLVSGKIPEIIKKGS